MTYVAHDAPAFLIPEPAAHPDFALIAAWEGYMAVRRAGDALLDAGHEGTEQFEELQSYAGILVTVLEKGGGVSWR